MSNHYLFPRLAGAASLARLADVMDKRLSNLEAMASTGHRDATYAATGGARAPEPVLRNLRERLRKTAVDLGYPRDLGRKTAAFDAQAAKVLSEALPIAPGEASRDDVWAFITLVLLPDIATWRFPEQQRDRLTGGVRNTFQRLWWRAYILHDAEARDPFWLVALPEDALVGLMERPALSSNRSVAVTIARSVAVISDSLPSKREAAWRDLYKRIRQRLVIVNFELLARTSPLLLKAEMASLVTATRLRADSVV